MDTYNEIILNQLNKSIEAAKLEGTYKLNSDSSKIKVFIDKYYRFTINNFILPYVLGDIENISIIDENNKSAKIMILHMHDDVELLFHDFGISMIVDNMEYHSTNAILGKLYYRYKKDIAGENINPLIIKDKEVIAYCGMATHVVIPEGVKRIGGCSFEHSYIENVTLPHSLVELRDYCFMNCKKLRGIKFNGEDIYIGLEVFDMASKDLAICVPKSIKKVGKNSFFGCDLLPKVIFN